MRRRRTALRSSARREGASRLRLSEVRYAERSRTSSSVNSVDMVVESDVDSDWSGLRRQPSGRCAGLGVVGRRGGPESRARIGQGVAHSPSQARLVDGARRISSNLPPTKAVGYTEPHLSHSVESRCAKRA